MPRVFSVTGAAGTIDGVEEAFNQRVLALTADPTVTKIDAKVTSDGIEETVYGPRPKITGYTIDVDYVQTQS